MKLFSDFNIGIQTYSQALKYIFRKKLGWFFLFPLSLNILIFWFGWNYMGSLSNDIQLQLENWINLSSADFWGAGVLQFLLNGFVWLAFKILFFLLFAYFGGYIIIILLSPVFSYLSERTEQLQTGTKYPFNIRRFLHDIIRGTLIALRNLAVELLLTIVLFFCSFIPVAGWLSPLVLFFVSAYFYGFSFMDYAIERKQLNINQSVQFTRSNKGVVIANGFIFSICLLIPFIGIFLSSFAAIPAVVSGTIAVNKTFKTSQNFKL